MMKKLKYLCAGMLALAVVAFVACDDDDEGLNGWTDTAYVYVQGETLGNDVLKQAVVIETEGCGGCHTLRLYFPGVHK